MKGRPWLAASLWMVILGPTFFLIYGGCNWITSLRTDVGTCYFEWEKSIPFVPIFIIPYMSIDLFFAGATFLCTSKSEIHNFAKRTLFAMVASASCFLLFPLQYGWPRPPVSGFLGQIFAPLTQLDQPYNLAPSLHISLRSMIWAIYGRHLTGILRVVVGFWFVLIGASTLLVYQHHVIDVLGGDIVAIVCFYLFPFRALSDEGPAKKSAPDSLFMVPNKRNWKVFGRYFFFSLLLLLVGYAARPSGLILVWPAVSLGIVAMGYLGVGPAIFRKYQGRLPWPARIILGPFLMGAYLSLLYYRRRGPLYNEVIPGVFIGCALSSRETKKVEEKGVRAVLDLTAEYSENSRFLQLAYHNIQILDLTVPSLDQLHEAVRFLKNHLGTSKIYIHCALGRSRSAVIVAAFILAEGLAASSTEAVAITRRARPQVVIHQNVFRVLDAFLATANRDFSRSKISSFSSLPEKP